MRTYGWNPTFVLETVKLLITYLEFFRQNRSNLRVMSELLIGLSVYQLFFPHPQVGRKNFKLPLHHDTYWLIEHSFFAFINHQKPLSFFEVFFVLLLLLPKNLIFCFICRCAPSPSRYLYILSEPFWVYLVHFRNNQFYVLLSALQWQCILSINYSNTNGTATIMQ